MSLDQKLKISQLNKKIKEEKFKSRLFGNKEGIEIVCNLMTHILDEKQKDGVDEVITREEMDSLIVMCEEIIENNQNKLKKNEKIIKPI